MINKKLLRLEQGFSLVEMLIAFTVIGFIITAVFTFYLAGLAGYNRGSQKMEYQQTARIAMDYMVRELKFAHLIKHDPQNGSYPAGEKIDMIYFRKHVNGTSIRYSFRLNSGRLLVDRRRDSNNSIRATNVIAMDISKLEFFIDENELITINIEAGEGPGRVTLTAAVRPRNLPRPGG